MYRLNLFLFTLVTLICSISNPEIVTSKVMSEGTSFVHVEFEVYGIVQGVFFRKHTVNKANELGLHGWCMNTNRGTVLGQMEGELGKIEEMKRWLKFTGSPSSKIEKAEFRNEKPIDVLGFRGFKVAHH